MNSVYGDDPRLEPLIGPGAMFEVEELVLDGVLLRDYVRSPMTVLDTFRMGAAHADLVHIVHDDRRLTFAEVQRQALSLARSLRDDFGVGKGDRVAIAMRNLPEFVVSFWGGAVLGAIVVPLNSWWTGDELAYALDDAGASVVFTDPERAERVAGGAARGAVQVVDLDLLAELVTVEPLADDELASIGRDDPVTILYTSGTTGRPKGALGTNRNHLTNLWNMAFGAAREAIISGRQPKPPKQSATITAAPLFHIGGIAGIIGGPMGGTKMVMLRKWDVEEAIRVALEEEVTNFGGVPAMARQLLERPGIETLGLDVRTFPMGGAPVAPDLPTRVVELFGDDVQLLNGYGSTETTSAVVTNVGVEFAARPDSVGRPNLTADVRIDGAAAPGDVGEILVRSPQVVRGYWNNDDATKEAFVDGWFRTGDIGYFDGEGFLYVVDRVKDVVIRGGENVYCVEVEAVLYEHPAVAQVTIVGLDERALGERVCAVVVPKAGASVTLDDLRAFAAERMAAFKCPEALAVVDALPETATNKVAKNVLRQQLAEPGVEIEKLW